MLPAVTRLIEAATQADVRAAYVEIDTFDSMMLRFWRNLPSRPAPLDANVRKSLPASVSIPVPAPGTGAPLMRLNALPIVALPTRALSVRTSEEIDWSTLRDIQREAGSRIIVTKGAEILCWGNRNAVTKAFAQNIACIEGCDLPSNLNTFDALPVKGFMEEALATALARNRPLLVRRRGLSPILIADAHAEDQTQLVPLTSVLGRLTGQIAGLFAPIGDQHPDPERVFFAEAIRISITQKNGATWLLADPDIWIWPPRAREVASEVLDDRRRDRLNAKFDRILDAWVKVLAGTSQRAAIVEVAAFDGDDPDANPRFTISSRTGFSWNLVG